jgi:hypothetical protein
VPRRCLSAWRRRRDTHSRTPYPTPKPTIRAIAISGIGTAEQRLRPPRFPLSTPGAGRPLSVLGRAPIPTEIESRAHATGPEGTIIKQAIDRHGRLPISLSLCWVGADGLPDHRHPDLRPMTGAKITRCHFGVGTLPDTQAAEHRQPQKRSGFEYTRTTEKPMIARSCQPEQSQNIIQFRPYLKFAPKCAQCRLRMAILRAEPDLKAREFRITYRCLECGLLDRRTI